MKTISKINKQSRVLANVLASLRIEQLTPSPAVAQGMQDCINGKTTTEQLLSDIQRRHVTLRRV